MEEHCGGVLLIVVIPLAFWVVGKLLERRRNLPPGPFAWPIIGSLHILGKTPHKTLAQLANTYGPLMSLKLGSLTTVVASSPSMAQQVLQKNDLVFSIRWVPDTLRAHDHSHFGLALLPVNPTWRTLRKFCQSQLFSNRSLDANQHLRQKKLEELLSYLYGCCEAGVAVNISQAVFSFNFNLLSTTFFSLDVQDPESFFCHEFKEIMSQITVLAGIPNVGDYFPALKGLDLQRLRLKMEESVGKIIKFLQRLIDERLAKGIDHRTPSDNDVLDVFLKLNLDDEEEFKMSYIMHSLLDLFVGGIETTTNTIEWAMTEFLRDKNKLKKARAELETVIGRGKRIKEGDISRLPYLQAVVKETLRLHPPVPLLVPRVARSDINLCGFLVPKDSQMLINIWAIGRDPSVWERPNCFEPERFLGTSQIDFKGQHFELLPFGGGRRICPGLLLANRILHLILGSLIHSFDWKLEDGVHPQTLDMDEKFGMAIHKATPLRAIPINV